MKLDDLQVTARLAHLGLGDADLRAALPAFEQMLDYFAVMQTADGSVPSEDAGTAHITAVHSDLVVPVRQFNNNNASNNSLLNNNSLSNQGNHNEANLPNNNLINQAGERNGNFIVVPNVL